MVTKRLRITGILLISFVLIGAFSLYITNRFVKQLSTEERQKIDLWVMGMKQLANTSNNDQDYSFILEVLRNNKTIPVILVDDKGEVANYMNIPDSKMNTPEEAAKKIAQMSESNPPITFTLYDNAKNTVYYDDSITLKRLSYYPHIFLVIIMLFVLIAFYAISQSWRAEQNGVWVGLAKETAHQLGTPTSSLMACLELLHDQNISPIVIEELGKDINRLERITNRFSKIGSNPDLSEIKLAELIDGSVSYLTGRISTKVKITNNYDGVDDVRIMGNLTLLEWVIENIVKNSVDAMQGEGSIDINVFQNSKLVFIDISDTGKGISKNNLNNVFNPGFTTKNRGWGLGLTLTKRIVEGYHKGKIFVLKSELNKGTTFRIAFRRLAEKK